MCSLSLSYKRLSSYVYRSLCMRVSLWWFLVCAMYVSLFHIHTNNRPTNQPTNQTKRKKNNKKKSSKLSEDESAESFVYELGKGIGRNANADLIYIYKYICIHIYIFKKWKPIDDGCLALFRSKNFEYQVVFFLFWFSFFFGE